MLMASCPWMTARPGLPARRLLQDPLPGGGQLPHQVADPPNFGDQVGGHPLVTQTACRHLPHGRSEDPLS